MRQITVGIPVFNAMPYLPDSLESILRQGFSDFDILVINDGSTDDSREYLRSVRDPRLRIVDQENRGVVAARNRMLAEVPRRGWHCTTLMTLHIHTEWPALLTISTGTLNAACSIHWLNTIRLPPLDNSAQQGETPAKFEISCNLDICSQSATQR